MDKKIITVTGATGYIASWIVRDLLHAGYEVRITVRDKSKIDKYQHLLDIEKQTKGELVVYEADLLKDGSFDEVIKGAEFVMHTASPFINMDKGDTQKLLVDPAVKGTKNVLNSVNKSATVKRVVLTSSVAAIYGDNRDMLDKGLKELDESCWNTTSSLTRGAYSYSKTQAEKAAWAMVEKQNNWDLITIHPGFVLGPSLTKRIDSTSINTMLRITKGEFKVGVPDLGFIFSDVRDIAKAHLLAAFNEKAKGRYIIANENSNLLKVANIIGEEYKDKYKLPSKTLPKWFLWLIAPTIGMTREFIKNNAGYPICASSKRSIDELGMSYFSFKDTVIDQVNQLESDGLI
jgi:nucleoside-diphosphate-sugar epimerase